MIYAAEESQTMKTSIAVIAALILLTSAAEAARKRTRVTVHPQQYQSQRPITQHPFAVDYVLRTILCSFHLFSIGPQGRPGSCIEHMPRRRLA
jgi:hypothetical protein